MWGPVSRVHRGEGWVRRGRVEETYAEHAAHAESPHLAEAPERLLSDIFDERIEGTLEKRSSRSAHLRMDADEEHERLVHVRPDLCGHNRRSDRLVSAS